MKYAVSVILVILVLTGAAFSLKQDPLIIALGLISIPGILAVMPWSLAERDDDQQQPTPSELDEYERRIAEQEARDHQVQPIGFNAEVKSWPALDQPTPGDQKKDQARKQN